MKKILSKIIFITLSLPLLVSAQSLNFGNTYTISSGADGYGRPRIALTNNQPIIIWRKDSTPKTIRASKWDGTNFTTPYDITSSIIN